MVVVDAHEDGVHEVRKEVARAYEEVVEEPKCNRAVGHQHFLDAADIADELDNRCSPVEFPFEDHQVMAEDLLLHDDILAVVVGSSVGDLVEVPTAYHLDTDEG